MGNRISNVTSDADTKIISLVAKAVPWSEVAGTYTLDFGHALPAVSADRSKRNWVDKLKKDGQELLNTTADIGHDVSNAVQGDLNKSMSESFSISAGSPGQRDNLVADTELVL